MRNYKALISVISLAIIFIISFPPAAGSAEDIKELYERAQVLEVKNLESETLESLGDQVFQEQIITVKILSGTHKGQIVEAHNTLSGSVGWDLNVKPGDKVILYMLEEAGKLTEVYLSDMVRVPYLLYLVIFFVLSLIIIGRIQGIKSLIALVFTILGVYKILLPALLKGMSPLLITILISLGVTLLTMIIVAGFTKKSFAATMGTIGGVLVAGLLALIVSKLAYLTGYASEESRMLLYVDGLNINMQGLLLAGIIIGALGATMDVAISIASAIEEIKKANPQLPVSALMRAGLNVGRDIMGTMTNTLILAYAGGALPLLMLFMAYETSSVSIFNSELIATEIVRALTGSIGLVFCVPITAFIASILSTKRR